MLERPEVISLPKRVASPISQKRYQSGVRMQKRRKLMTKDLTVILEDRPGTLADMLEGLGKAGINIEGACALVVEGKGIVHILVEDAAAARRTLEEVGIEVGDEREVLVLEVEDRPGAGGEVARRIANAGVNVDRFYMATNNRAVIAVDDLDKARTVV